MKSEFTNRAAHELRTPLAILMGYASVMEEDAESVQRSYLEIILRNAMRLRAIIADLLNIRFIERGPLPLTLSEVDLMAMIDNLLQDVTLLAEQKQVTLASKLAGPLPPLLTDQQKLELILINLLTNAIKFTPAEGAVWIDGGAATDHIEIIVADIGIGIAPTEHKKIFSSFYQIEDSLNREYSGIGLGLAITKGMIERCGGAIRVESALGQGSRFICTLPLRGPDQAEIVSPQSPFDND
jgi:signal transduction histidine kinase